MTVSGLFGAYYFQSEYQGGTENGKYVITVQNPTAKAAQRALTTSFGSVCFGSLVVAILKTIKAILRTIASNSEGGAGMFLAMVSFSAKLSVCSLSHIMDRVVDSLLQRVCRTHSNTSGMLLPNVQFMEKTIVPLQRQPGI